MKLGASLSDAIAAVSTVHLLGTDSHPPRSRRINAVKEGYQKALSTGPASKDEPDTDEYSEGDWVWFSGNEYHGPEARMINTAVANDPSRWDECSYCCSLGVVLEDSHWYPRRATKSEIQQTLRFAN